MSGERDLEIRLALSDKEALSRLHTALKSVENQSKQSAKAMTMSWTELAAQFYLVQNALRPIINFMSSAIHAAAEQEDAVNRLNVALEAQGYNVTAVSAAYQRMATDMQRSTRFGDEAIMQVQQQLTTFGKVGPESMQRVTQAVLDLATAKKIDLRAATDLMSKAAVGETGTLSRYGIIIDQTIPKTEKFAAVLKLVEERMGGSAQADTLTYSGAVAQLKNSWGDLLENFGSFVSQSPAIVLLIQGMQKNIEAMSAAIVVFKPEIDSFFNAILLGFKNLEVWTLSALVGVEKFKNALGFGDKEFTSALDKQLQESLVRLDAHNQEVLNKQEVLNTAKEQQELTFQEQVSAVHKEFNEKDYQDRILTEEKKIEAQRQQLLAWYDEKREMEMAHQQQLNEMLTFALDAQKKAHESLWSVAGKARDAFSSSMSSMLINLMKGTANLKEAFVELGWNMIKILVDYAVQLAVNMAISKAMQAANLAATIPIASATASAWAPAAAMVSLATFGANAASAAAAMTSTVALAQALALLSSVPGLAEGGTATASGIALVGERGPELIQMPRGASIIPLTKTAGQTIIYVNVEINNPVISSREIADDIAAMIASKVSEIIDVERERL